MSAILSHPCALVPEHGDHYSNGFSDKGLKNYKISGAQSAPGALFLFLSMGCMPAGLVPMSVYDDRLVEMLTRLCEISHKTGSRSPPIAPRFRVRPPFPGHNAAPEYRQILQSLTAFYSSPGEAPVPFPYVNRILKGHGPYPPKALAIALTTPPLPPPPPLEEGFFLHATPRRAPPGHRRLSETRSPALPSRTRRPPDPPDERTVRFPDTIRSPGARPNCRCCP